MTGYRDHNVNALMLKVFLDALDEADQVTLRGKHSQNDFVLAAGDVEDLKHAIENRLHNLYHADDFTVKVPRLLQPAVPSASASAEVKPLTPAAVAIFWSVVFAMCAAFIYLMTGVFQVLHHGY